MKTPAVVAFVAALIVNPALLVAGCGPHFGENEAVRLVAFAGNHKTYRFVADGSDFEATVDLVQATEPTKLSARGVDFLQTAHACGERTFVRSAHACLDITKVPVVGTVSVRRLAPSSETVIDRARLMGDVVIDGTTIRHARVELRGTSPKDVLILSSNDGSTFALDGLHLSRSDSAPLKKD